MKFINEEQSLGGWSRIVATIAQLSTVIAIGMNQPEAASDLAEVGSLGSGIIASGYALYAQVVLFAGAAASAWSKFYSVFKK